MRWLVPALLVIPVAIAAQSPRKSTDLVHVLGMQAGVRRATGDSIVIGGSAAYVLAGTLALQPRGSGAGLAAALTARGAEQVIFLRRDSLPCVRPNAALDRQLERFGAWWVIDRRAKQCTSPAVVSTWDALIGALDAGAGRRLLEIGFPTDTSRIDIGYVAMIPATSPASTTLEIVIAARGAEPWSYLTRLDVVSAASLPTWLTASFQSVAVALVVAVLGYAGFRAQQQFLVERDAERTFAAARITRNKELAQKIRQYQAIRNAAGFDDEQRFANLTDHLVETGIYAMLPLADATRIDEMRRSTATERVAKLDALIRRRFPGLLS